MVCWSYLKKKKIGEKSQGEWNQRERERRTEGGVMESAVNKQLQPTMYAPPQWSCHIHTALGLLWDMSTILVLFIDIPFLSSSTVPVTPLHTNVLAHFHTSGKFKLTAALYLFFLFVCFDSLTSLLLFLYILFCSPFSVFNSVFMNW